MFVWETGGNDMFSNESVEKMKCPICKRELTNWSVSSHHLIPKTFKGKETVDLHKICHRKLHSVYTEREMVKYFHTIERLLEHNEIIKFVKWVSKKNIDFYNGSKETTDRKSKRRR